MNKTWNVLIVAITLVLVTYIFTSNKTLPNTDTRDVVFKVGTNEMLRLALNGDFIVKGKVVVNDVEVYAAFKNWVALSNQVLAKNKLAASTVISGNAKVPLNRMGKVPIKKK